MDLSRTKEETLSEDESSELLRNYIFEDDLDKINELIKDGIAIDSDFWKTPIVELRGYFYGSPLMYALLEGDSNRLLIMEKLIDAGADVFIEDRNGRSLAMKLVTEKDDYAAKMMLMLIKKGIDINRRRENEPFCLLHLSAFFCRYEMTKVLVESGANVNLISKDGDTPLDLAAVSAENKVEVIEILVEHGADFKSICVYKERLFHVVLEAGGSFKLVKFLLDRGVDTNSLGEQGNRPIHLAVTKSSLKTVKLLCMSGSLSSINSINKKGESPLFLAASSGRVDVVKFFIESGVGVDIDSTKRLVYDNSGFSLNPYEIMQIKARIDLAEHTIEKAKKIIELGSFNTVNNNLKFFNIVPLRVKKANVKDDSELLDYVLVDSTELDNVLLKDL